MNPFVPGDRVCCSLSKKYGGKVLSIFCKRCINCLNKNYDGCLAAAGEKGFVLAVFIDPITGDRKKYSYDYYELEKEAVPIIPANTPRTIVKKQYDFTPTDLIPLGTTELNLPSMPYEDSEQEINSNSDPNSGVELADNSSFTEAYDDFAAEDITHGLAFDRYLELAFGQNTSNAQKVIDRLQEQVKEKVHLPVLVSQSNSK